MASSPGVHGTQEASNTTTTTTTRVYLFNCPFDEKEEAKHAGARWDSHTKQWYVLSLQRLEGFNRWQPNGRIYLDCPYQEKEAAKQAGAHWDGTTKQWYITVRQHTINSNNNNNSNNSGATFRRWLPSSSVVSTASSSPSSSSLPSSPRRPPPSHSKQQDTRSTPSNKSTTTIRSNRHLATLPRINAHMTVAQLTQESKARDPTLVGLSKKNKEWFLAHLQVGTPWISAIPPKEKKETKNRASCPKKQVTAPDAIKKRKTATIITTKTKSKTKTKKVAVAVVSKIHREMTIAQLVQECRARDPNMKGLSNKNKEWFLEHLKIGSALSDKSKDSGVKKKSSVTTVPAVSQKLKKSSSSSQTNKTVVQKKNKENAKNKKTTSTKNSSSSQTTKTGSQKRPATESVVCTNRSNKKLKKDPVSKTTHQRIKKETIISCPPHNPIIKVDPDGEQLTAKKEKKKDCSVMKNDPGRSITKTTSNNKTTAATPCATTVQTTSTTQTKRPVPISVTSNGAKASARPLNGDAARYTRISNKMTLATLRKEADARQMDKVPKLKSDLLRSLVDDSICVHESTEYRSYQNLLTRIRTERAVLHKASMEKEKIGAVRKEELRLKRQEKENQRRTLLEHDKEEKRRNEIFQQKALHVHSFPRVHRHALAMSDQLVCHGAMRSDSASCDNCRSLYYYDGRRSSSVYSCEICDWDICQSCFNSENKSDAEKERIRMERVRKREAERQVEEREEEIETEEYERRWNAKIRFQSSILKPKGQHLEHSRLKYTVWCSDGYDNDGWHSYEGEPIKEFDSVWNSKKDANDRAEYLFYWKNPWGTQPEEVMGNYIIEDEPEYVDGLVTRTVAPEDSSRWTVGVVPSVAYRHIPNTTHNRHNLDDQEDDDYCGGRTKQTARKSTEYESENYDELGYSF